MSNATGLLKRALEELEIHGEVSTWDLIKEIRAFLAAEPEAEPLAWIPEDELPERYPYNFMFQYSKVDIIRWFPIYGPPEPAIRKPMTEREIMEQAKVDGFNAIDTAVFAIGVRWAERMHGIGGDDGQ